MIGRVDQIGGCRTSNATQCKLRRVTGRMVVPRPLPIISANAKSLGGGYMCARAPVLCGLFAVRGTLVAAFAGPRKT
jgi:hypothetical protein